MAGPGVGRATTGPCPASVSPRGRRGTGLVAAAWEPGHHHPPGLNIIARGSSRGPRVQLQYESWELRRSTGEQPRVSAAVRRTGRHPGDPRQPRQADPPQHSDLAAGYLWVTILFTGFRLPMLRGCGRQPRQYDVRAAGLRAGPAPGPGPRHHRTQGGAAGRHQPPRPRRQVLDAASHCGSQRVSTNNPISILVQVTSTLVLFSNGRILRKT